MLESARARCSCRLIVPARVEFELSKEFSRGRVHDSDLEVLDQQKHVGSGVGSPNADVVQLAVQAEGDAARIVDPVPPNPIVGVGLWGPGLSLRPGRVGTSGVERSFNDR
jgi:hypothetical protein